MHFSMKNNALFYKKKKDKSQIVKEGNCYQTNVLKSNNDIKICIKKEPKLFFEIL